MTYSPKLCVSRQLGTEQFVDVVASTTVTASTTALSQDCGTCFQNWRHRTVTWDGDWYATPTWVEYKCGENNGSVITRVLGRMVNTVTDTQHRYLCYMCARPQRHSIDSRSLERTNERTHESTYIHTRPYTQARAHTYTHKRTRTT